QKRWPVDERDASGRRRKTCAHNHVETAKSPGKIGGEAPTLLGGASAVGCELSSVELAWFEVEFSPSRLDRGDSRIEAFDEGMALLRHFGDHLRGEAGRGAPRLRCGRDRRSAPQGRRDGPPTACALGQRCRDRSTWRGFR